MSKILDPKILIVENDAPLLAELCTMLRHAGFLTSSARDSRAALRAWMRGKPDLVMLDLGLPPAQLKTLYQKMRSRSKVPILLLAHREDEQAVVEGLNWGAEDYIFKPFKSQELAARVRVVLQRLSPANLANSLKAGGMTLDCIRNEVHCRNGSAVIRLTPLESRLLQVFMLNAGQVLDHPTLMESIWGSIQGEQAMLKQLVYRLRRKLDPVFPATCPIKTISGVGYGFV